VRGTTGNASLPNELADIDLKNAKQKTNKKLPIHTTPVVEEHHAENVVGRLSHLATFLWTTYRE
jgi:hypothetical protein